MMFKFGEVVHNLGQTIPTYSIIQIVMWESTLVFSLYDSRIVFLPLEHEKSPPSLKSIVANYICTNRHLFPDQQTLMKLLPFDAFTMI